MTSLACDASGQMVADLITLWRRRCRTTLHLAGNRPASIQRGSIFMALPSADVLRPAHRNAILCALTAQIVAHFADHWINFPATKWPDLIAIFRNRVSCTILALHFGSAVSDVLTATATVSSMRTAFIEQLTIDSSREGSHRLLLPVSFYDFQWITSLTDNHRLLSVFIDSQSRRKRSTEKIVLPIHLGV